MRTLPPTHPPRSAPPRPAVTFNTGLFCAVIAGYVLGTALLAHVPDNYAAHRRARQQRLQLQGHQGMQGLQGLEGKAAGQAGAALGLGLGKAAGVEGGAGGGTPSSSRGPPSTGSTDESIPAGGKAGEGAKGGPPDLEAGMEAAPAGGQGPRGGCCAHN